MDLQLQPIGDLRNRDPVSFALVPVQRKKYSRKYQFHIIACRQVVKIKVKCKFHPRTGYEGPKGE